MQEEKSGFFEKLNNWIRNSITIRLITIGILLLLMLIPVSMVQDLIREREYRQREAVNEISSTWGEQQTIKGLVLTVPYQVYTKVFDKDNSDQYRLVKTTHYAHFLPDDLSISGKVIPEIRYRGIFEVVVYRSSMKINGTFSHPSFHEWNIEQDILWKDAFVSLGLSDLRSIQQNVNVNWNGTFIPFNPGVEVNDVISSGISARTPLNNADSASMTYQFSLDLEFNGSSGLSFIPLGKETNVKLESEWKEPSFNGAFLPDDREIHDDGFTAKWNVLHLNRSYPQQFQGNISNIEESAFGVDLLMPVDEYQKSTRAAKYAVLFITLTFLVFFFIQVLNRVKIHPIQYIMVGLALCIFYTLLISISEHLKFATAYLIGSTAIILMISGYAASIFRKKRLTLVLLFILVILYGFIYTIIQLQDYALLMGSIGLFIVLAIVMYLSRNINWYDIGTITETNNKK